MECYKCLYTKHLVKKRKTWEDGFLVVKAGLAVLHDDDGRQLQEGVRLPSSALSSDDGPLKSFAGLLVTVEEKCGVQDLPSGLSDAGKLPSAAACNLGASAASTGTLRTEEPGSNGAGPAQRKVVPSLGRRTCQHFMPPKPITTKVDDNLADVSNIKGVRTKSTTGKPQQLSHGAQHLHDAHAQQHAVDPQTHQDSDTGCLLDGRIKYDVNNPNGGQRQQHPGFAEDTPWGSLDRSTLSSNAFQGADPSADKTGASRGGAGARPITATTTVLVPCGSAFQENRPAMRSDDDILALIGLVPESLPKPAHAVQHKPTTGTNPGNHHMGFNGSQNRGPGSCAGILGPDVSLQQRLTAGAPVLKDSHSSGSGLWVSRYRQPQLERPQPPDALTDLNWDSTELDDPWDGADNYLTAGSGHGGRDPVLTKSNVLRPTNTWGGITATGRADPLSAAAAPTTTSLDWAGGGLAAGVASSVAAVPE
ncbi:hypothetical protein Vretimale_10647, partial [Volvox reticuliferus]